MNGHKKMLNETCISVNVSVESRACTIRRSSRCCVRNIDAAEMRQLKGRGYGFEISAVSFQSSSHRTTLKWIRIVQQDTLEDRTRWTRAICIASGLNMKRNDQDGDYRRTATDQETSSRF